MRGINKIILLGHVGHDPEVRQTNDGRQVTKFSLATNYTYLDKSGTRREEVEWHKVVSFGRLAEICGEYLQAGRHVYLEGRVRTRQWNDAEGQTRYMTEVLADTMQLLNRGKDSGRSYNQPATPIVREEAMAQHA